MKKIICLSFLILVLLSLTGCSQNTPTPTATQPVATSTPPPPTSTPLPPTPTPLPQAANVNGEGILLSEYEAEVQRQQASDTSLGQQSTPQEISQRDPG